jgi:hypothetical protein
MGMNEQDFYAQHTDITDPGDLSDLFAGLPSDVASLSEILQGVAMHRDHTDWRFGFVLSDERYKEGETRHVRDILKLLGDLRERPAETRFAATCRDFCVLLCAMLRHAGVPARIRGGYANYFPRKGGPRLLDDHWVVEYWHEEHGWRLADSQVAGSATNDYGVDFDPADVPRDRFVVAGQAWLASRSGERDPDTFIVSGLDESGFAVILGTVVRDLAALNGVEGFPWDTWGIMTVPLSDLTEPDVTLIDRAAGVGANGGPFDHLIDLYQSQPRLRADGLTG